jgi:hypothetical protein
MSTSPVDDLQLKALDERADLHRTVYELREQLGAIRDKFRFTKQAREHMAVACGLATVLGLLGGYAFGGVFVRRCEWLARNGEDHLCQS